MFKKKTEKTFFFLKLFVREMTNIINVHALLPHQKNKQTRRQNIPYMCILTGRKSLDHKEVVECTIMYSTTECVDKSKCTSFCVYVIF